MPDRPYLVTGGAGFIGSNLVDALIRRGESVRVLDNLSTGSAGNLASGDGRVELIEGDLRDEDAVRRAVAGVRCVFHLAALPSVIRSVEDPVTTHDVNCTGTLRLLVEARDAGVERMVLASSSSVYGATHVLPKHEDLPLSPLSPYALSKLAGEHYARMFHSLYGLKTFSLRYFNVFGPRQDPESAYAAAIPLFIDALTHDRSPTIYGDGEQTRDFTYVEDVVSANLACMEAATDAAGSVFNVAPGNRISVNQLVHHIALALGKDHIEPSYVPPRPGEVRDSQADSTRAREQLNWEARVPFEEGIRRTVEWFGQHRSAP